jgi:hypothetical protein
MAQLARIHLRDGTSLTGDIGFAGQDYLILFHGRPLERRTIPRSDISKIEELGE